MPLNLRASEQARNFNFGVAYRAHDNSGKFLDARNVNTIQNRLDTRFGTSRYNTETLGGSIKSLSAFTKTDGTIYHLAKVGTDLKSVSVTGSHTTIKGSLSLGTVHRGKTENNRHIIALGSDGLFSWNGTIFTQLGQASPSTLDVAQSNGGSLTDTNIYKVGISFYASSIGFETDILESGRLTVSSTTDKIDLSDIPTVADNLLIDTVYIYLKNVTANGDYIFNQEIPLGTATATITEETSSSQTPSRNNGPVRDGGGKFIEFFNSKMVYSGRAGYLNEVYFSEERVPDAFNANDDATILVIPGQGAVSGMAVGLFNESVLEPYLVIFKPKSTHIYSEIGGVPKFVTINDKIGCVSNDTIQIKNGNVYFLSEEGWRGISGGRFIVDKQGDAITLGMGDIDDIFNKSGFTYEVNRVGLANAFSVYYPTLDQYMTWVQESLSNEYTKTYVYEFASGGFKPFEFAVPATCAILGENGLGRNIVLFGTADGFILKHSIIEEKSDVDSDNVATAINAFALIPWIPENGDSDASYNYRELILKAINSTSPLTVKTFVNYDISTNIDSEYDFTNRGPQFVLDVSALDSGILGDDRAIVTERGDINRVGETLAIGFYQSEIGANIGLVSMQVDLSKNGNRNLHTDNAQEEGGFDYDDETIYASVAESARQAAYWAAIAAANAGGFFAAGVVYLGDPDTNGTWRVRVSGSVLLIEVRLSGAWEVRDEFNP